MEIIADIELNHNSGCAERVTVRITQDDIEQLVKNKVEEQHGDYWYATICQLEVKMKLVDV